MPYGDGYAIFVGGLSWRTSDQELLDAFVCFGNILCYRICTEKSTGRSRGFGFVTFANRGGMINAIMAMDGQDLDGRIITVGEATNSRRKGEYVERGYSGGYLSRSMEHDEGRCFNCGWRGHWARDCSYVHRHSRPSSPSRSWYERNDSEDSFGEDRGRYEDEQRDREYRVEDHFDCTHDDRVTSNRGTAIVSLSSSRYKQCEKCENCSAFQKGEGEGNGEACLTAVNFSQENSRTMLATTVLLDELSFKLVESEKFQKFCHSLQPEFVIPSRVTIVKDWFQIYLSQRKRLKDILTQNSQRVCLTIDTWTSVLEENYMVLTAHFTDNSWDLHERILNFCQISNFEGETIVRTVEKCLLEWGIKKVFTITVGRSSYDEAVTSYLRHKFTAPDSVVLNGEFLYVKSSSHVLSLFINDAWKILNKSISQIGNIAKNISFSPARLQTFTDLAKENIPQTEDIFNLMNEQPGLLCSTIEVIKLCKFLYTFEKIKVKDPSFFSEVIPSTEIWVNGYAFVKLLKILVDVDFTSSGSLCVAPNEYFPKLCSIQVLIRECSQYQNDNPSLSRMLRYLQARFNKYWGDSKKTNFLLYVAVVLDPRYKLNFLKERFREFWGDDVADKMTAKVKKTLQNMCDEYLFNMTRDELNAGIAAHIGSSQPSLAEKFKRFLEIEAPNDCKNEIDNYLQACCHRRDDKDLDVLNWWKLNSSRFLILGQIAKDIFAIPLATSVFKSHFKDEARVLDRFRNSFPPKMLEASICAQNWLRSKPFMADVGDEIEDVDAVDQEFSKIAMEMNLDSIAD